MPNYSTPESASAASGGGFQSVAAPSLARPSFNQQIASASMGGDPTQDDQPERPYASVGKLGTNFLRLPSANPEEGVPPPEDHGGFFAGILGALGGTFGEGGRAVGETVGKVVEAPLGLAGGALGLLGGVNVPLGSEIAGAVGGGLEAVGLTKHGQQAPAILTDLADNFGGNLQDNGQRQGVNLGGIFQGLLNTFGLLGRAVERKYAEGALVASGLGTGSAVLGRREALPADLLEAVKSGQMTTDEALDSLVMRGAGFSDNPVGNIALSVLLDPLNVASAGVGLVGKAASAVTKVERAAQIAGDLGKGERLTAAQALSRVGETGEQAGMQLGRLERTGLAIAGRTPGFEQVIVPLANQVTRLTDPLKLFGSGNIGKRSTEHIAMAASSGVIAAFKAPVVRRMSAVLGDDKLNRLLGLRTTNLLEQIVVDDMSAEAMKAGRIPFLTGEAGVALTPTQAARAVREGGAFDANVGKTVELMVEKQKPFLTHLTPEALRSQTAEKVAAMGGDASKLGDVSYDDAALIHALYFDHMASGLVDNVRPALKAMGDALPGDIVPERLTTVSERTLTAQRLPPLEAALKAGDGAAVRRFLAAYDDFNWINGDAVALEKNADLFDVVTKWLETNRGGLLHEVPLTDAATGVMRTDIPAQLSEWGADAEKFGYRLALSPPTDVDPSILYRLTKDDSGRVLHAKPWLDYTSEVTAVTAPNRLQSVRSSLFRQVRAERILWTNQRRFVQSIARDGISERDGLAIYRRIMYTASEAGVTARGLAPEQMYDAAKAAIKTAKGIAPDITEKQVVNHLLVAFKGDLSQVGLTQGLTGAIKAKAPGSAANYWGRVSEHLYPLAKFTLAPWFLTQEIVEPYVLNLMRGVPVPLRKSSPRFQEALAMRNAFNQVVRNSLEPDGAILEMAEYQKMLAISAQEVHRTVGSRGGFFGKIGDSLWGDVALRKQAAEALLTKKVFGQNLKKALTEMRGPGHWEEMERTYRTTDAGDIAFQWMADQFHIAGANGERIGAIADMLNPMNIGRSTRIKTGIGDGVRWHDLGRWLGRTGDPDVIERDLIGSMKSGALTRSAFVKEATDAGLPAEFATRAYHMATGPEVGDFWREYQKTFMRPIKGATAKAQETAAHRALVQARSAAMGISEEEFIKTHFAVVPERLTAASALDGVDALKEIRQDITTQIVQRHGGSLEAARQTVGQVGAKGKAPSFRSRMTGGLLDRAGTINRSVMAELDDTTAAENLFNHLSIADPGRLREMIPTLDPANQRHAEAAIARAEASVPTTTMQFGEGKQIERYGNVTADHLLEQNLGWMDSGQGLAAGHWYPDMRQRFTDVFGDVDGPVLLAFAVSQASSAPTVGMGNVLRAIENLFAGGFEARALAKEAKNTAGAAPVLMAKGREVIDAAGKVATKTSQLNESNIVKALIGAPINERFGPKLNDFLDSLLGNSSRRWTGRSGDLQPAAIDRWTARDMGLLDNTAMTSVVRRHGKDLGDGTFMLGDRHLKPIGERLDRPKDWRLLDDEGNDLGTALDFMDAPTDLQYERGVQLMNELKDKFNAHVDPASGVQGVWGKTDWTAADVQAVGWIRMQKVMGGAEESPFATFAANQQVIATEVSAEAGSDWAGFHKMMDAIPPEATERVTGHMNTWLSQKIREMFGTSSVVTDWVGPARWQGGERTLSAPSVWLATPETGDDIADVTALAFRQREVWNPHFVPKTTFNPAIHHPVVDLVYPHTADVSRAKDELTRIADALDAPGATMLKNGEGNLVLRIIDRPVPGGSEFFPRHTATTAAKKAGMADADQVGQMYEDAIRKAGLDPAAFDPVDIAHADVYIAGPRLRPSSEELGAAIQKAYDDGDIELGQRLQREAGAALGGTAESGGAIKATGAPASPLMWETAVEDTVARLGQRGRRIDPDALRSLSDEATGQLRDVLRSEHASATRAAERGEPLLDSRAGSVLGFTRRVDGDTRLVIGGLKAADPVTGLHELVHVFASDLDDSMKDVVKTARRNAIDADRGDLEARIAEADAKAAAAGSPRSAGRWGAKAAALRHDLGAFAHEEDWGVQHEEWFVDQFHRWVRGGEVANPTLVPAFQHFKNWIDKVWGSIKGKTKTEAVSPGMKGLFDEMFSKPKALSTNYDMETYANRLAGKQALMAAQDEAFTTQYFKMGRSFAERSINHPFAGLYPFSYMWGKVMPEMFRFMALRPFGFEAPMLMWNATREVSDTVAAQQQLDPGFKEWMTANKDSFQVVNSLFPALPNDVPYNAPLWMRRIAEQGLENADRQAAGKAQKSIDYTKGLSDSAEYVFGPASAIRQFGSLAASVGDTARRVVGMPNPGDKPAPTTIGVVQGLPDLTAQP